MAVRLGQPDQREQREQREPQGLLAVPELRALWARLGLPDRLVLREVLALLVLRAL